MKYKDLFESKNPGYKPGEPFWQLDIDNKVYTVHHPDGTEVSRHPFQFVWDSSPAKRAAVVDYNQLKTRSYQEKKKRDDDFAESKPLSNVEKKYFDLHKSVEKYQKYIWPKLPEDDILDDETRQLYIQTATKWLDEMNRLAAGGTIRKSIINGTYKPPIS